MIEHALVTLLLIITTVFISYRGLNNDFLLEKYCFDTEKILVNKDYLRFVSSGFFHLGWSHLIFNMLALYAFGSMIEPLLGSFKFLMIYFLSLIGGGAISLFIHKNHHYTSAGASGAINGIIYACIALFPTMGIGFFFIPVSIPAWAFGIAYVIFTIFGIRSKWGNTGHTSHLGGALVGMLCAIAIYPEVLSTNYLPILAILLPTIAFLLLVTFKPQLLVIDGSSKRKQFHSIDHEYNYRKSKEQADIDTILEKIHKRGMKSLLPKERQALEQYSKMKK